MITARPKSDEWCHVLTGCISQNAQITHALVATSFSVKRVILVYSLLSLMVWVCAGRAPDLRMKSNLQKCTIQTIICCQNSSKIKGKHPPLRARHRYQKLDRPYIRYLPLSPTMYRPSHKLGFNPRRSVDLHWGRGPNVSVHSQRSVCNQPTLQMFRALILLICLPAPLLL